MEAIRFHARVGVVRLARALGCLRPLTAPRPTDAIEPVDLPGRPDLVVAPSLIPEAGLGVFAGRPFASGELICVYTGIILTTIEALRTPDWRYMVVLGRNSRGKRVWIDARPTPAVIARYINHHFDPARRNVETEALPDETRWLMKASRAIDQGEELYYDYGDTHWYCFDRTLGPSSRRR